MAQSIARYPAKHPGKSVGIGGGGVTYDAAALDYFTRAEGLGGSFDLTGISGTYTESYTKAAIDAFVKGCKADGVWGKLTEVYLLAGVTYAGVLAKLKHAGTATLTNTNFVTGDYAAAGNPGGLYGGDLNKRLDTGLNWSSINGNNFSFGVYITQVAASPATQRFIQDDGNGLFFESGSTTRTIWGLPNIDARIDTAAASNGTGFHLGVRRGVNDVEAYINGTSFQADTASASYTTLSRALKLWDGTSSATRLRRVPFACLSSGLTGLNDTDAANLSTRVNALMTAIGANVY